tara:strand:+ start:96 stop:518 length:423 start_codon:yes stop_codon:yes gene_type:complete
MRLWSQGRWDDAIDTVEKWDDYRTLQQDPEVYLGLSLAGLASDQYVVGSKKADRNIKANVRRALIDPIEEIRVAQLKQAKLEAQNAKAEAEAREDSDAIAAADARISEIKRSLANIKEESAEVEKAMISIYKEGLSENPK